MDPYAACYGGHQFGNWAGQLGDGRAITLGEAHGRDGKSYELQLKGAGPTPYSRSADGRAVLRSSVREFLCSEAMHHLGVPTTRALSLITTGEDVVRDMFYDGRARPEPGAVVCRVAPSFLRFGSFEIFASRADHGTLEALARHALRHHFADLGEPGPAAYAQLFQRICRDTAVMIAHWMRVGFVHGVMNTDNMSILGLTIDYGPYGWLDAFEPDWTPNTTDASGRRYRYRNQPGIALWNLVRLAEALAPLVGELPPLEQGLQLYQKTLHAALVAMLHDKLGLRGPGAPEPALAATENDPMGIPLADPLIAELLQVLQVVETDWTIFFRQLAGVPATDPNASDEQLLQPLDGAYYDLPARTDEQRSRVTAWLRRYAERVRSEGLAPAERTARMMAANPRYVLRNYLAQQAIDAAEQGDFAPVRELLDVMRRPYDEQPGRERYAERRPEWARHRAGCSMLSCSS
jgi:uncharacterized protein YdiU (UPF0061 family)